MNAQLGDEGDVGFDGFPGRPGREGQKGSPGDYGDNGPQGYPGLPGFSAPVSTQFLFYHFYSKFVLFSLWAHVWCLSESHCYFWCFFLYRSYVTQMTFRWHKVANQ